MNQVNPYNVKIEDLRVYFPVRKKLFGITLGEQQFVRAVDCVTLDIGQGEIWGLVGESGSGKTTLGKTLAMLIKPTSGEILFQKWRLNQLEKREVKKVRKEIQMIFQDPFSSLNPRKTVYTIIESALQTHGLDKKYEKELLMEVQTTIDDNKLTRYIPAVICGKKNRCSYQILRVLCPLQTLHLLLYVLKRYINELRILINFIASGRMCKTRGYGIHIDIEVSQLPRHGTRQCHNRPFRSNIVG